MELNPNKKEGDKCQLLKVYLIYKHTYIIGQIDRKKTPNCKIPYKNY